MEATCDSVFGGFTDWKGDAEIVPDSGIVIEGNSSKKPMLLQT